MRLAENREAPRVRALFHAEIREEELITRIAELQLDIHCLNNTINPIPHPVPVNHEEAVRKIRMMASFLMENLRKICSLAMISMLMYQFPSLYVMGM